MRVWLRCWLPRLLVCGGAAIILVLIGLALIVRDVTAAAREVTGARDRLHGVLEGGDFITVSRGDVQPAQRQLADAASRLQRDRRLLSPLFPLLRAAGPLPLVGPVARQLPDLLEALYGVAQGGSDLTLGVDGLLAAIDSPGPATNASASGADNGGADAGPASRMIAALDAGAPFLSRGDRTLHQVATIGGRLQPAAFRGPLAPVGRQLATLDQQLPAILQRADTLALLPGAARALLGFDGPRTYLIIGQDSAELRPTGGFIGSAGLLTLERGRVVLQEYRSSYDFDPFDLTPTTPPPPLAQYLGIGDLTFRDANWSPDFPTTTTALSAFLNRDLGVQVDGVMAFDIPAVTALLAQIGPITVAGYDVPLTAANWFDLTTQKLYTGAGALTKEALSEGEVKSIGLGAVLQAILQRAQDAQAGSLLQFVTGLRQATAGRHLLLAVNDARPSIWLSMVGADGAIMPAPLGDVVALVDANVSYSKTSTYVERQLRYEVWLGPEGQPDRAQLTASYRNTVTQAILDDPLKRIYGTRFTDTGSFVDSPGLFASYARLYIPGGATAIGVTGLSGPGDITYDGDYRVIGGLVSLDPQQRASITYTYRPRYQGLPAGEYRLTLYRQSGVDVIPAEVIVHLPTGMGLRETPAGGTVSGGTVTFAQSLTGVNRLSVQLVRRSGS